jgi:alkyldihydroxyacetonephosphate synthase
MCLSFIGYEGSEGHVAAQRKAIGKIVGEHGGVCIGRGPGELYDQKKFDTPYIRDYLLDRGALGDVSETAAPWSALPKVYDNVMAVACDAFDRLGIKGYIMSHLSHSYHGGACLYFTFAFRPAPARDGLEDYMIIKSAIQQAFVDSGATLSHHHAVGTEHAPWLEQDISAPGVTLVRALFDALDPGANLNPGKIVAADPARIRAARP